jgi:hypothetical protein
MLRSGLSYGTWHVILLLCSVVGETVETRESRRGAGGRAGGAQEGEQEGKQEGERTCKGNLLMG